MINNLTIILCHKYKQGFKYLQWFNNAVFKYIRIENC